MCVIVSGINMYKHARVPLLLNKTAFKPVKASPRSSHLGELLLVVGYPRIPTNRQQEHISLKRKALVAGGVSYKTALGLPELIYLSKNVLSAYRIWCRIIGVPDETKAGVSGDVERKKALTLLAQKDAADAKLRAAKDLDAQLTKEAKKQQRKITKRQQRKRQALGQPAAAQNVEDLTKTKVKNNSAKDDIFTKGRRLPGSAFSKQR